MFNAEEMDPDMAITHTSIGIKLSEHLGKWNSNQPVYNQARLPKIANTSEMTVALFDDEKDVIPLAHIFSLV
jgi:hypothetical protein